VAPLRRSSAGWMSARIGRWCRRRVWALRHQTEAQYSVKWTRDKVAVRNVVAPASQPEPGSRLKSARRDVNFLQKVSRGVGDIMWVSYPTLLRGRPMWARSKRAGFVVVVDFPLTFSFLVVRGEDCQKCFLL